MMQRDTKVIVVETEPYKKTTCVWTAYKTVGEVIDYVYKQTEHASWQTAPWLGLSTPLDFMHYQDGKTDSSFESTDAYQQWLDSRTIEDIFDACIGCAKQGGHRIVLHFSKEQAEADQPHYMSAEDYAAALEQY